MFDRYRFLFRRMFKRQHLAVQRNSFGECQLATVLTVAHNRTPDGCKLHSDLMFASGEQFYFDKILLLEVSDLLNLQTCGLRRVWVVFFNSHHAMISLVFHDPVFQFQRSRCRRQLADVRGDRQVRFVRLLCRELFRQPSGGLGRSRHDDDARDERVEPADNADVHVARFAVLLFEVLSGFVDKAGLPRLGSHRWQQGRFVDDQQVIVFV